MRDVTCGNCGYTSDWTAFGDGGHSLEDCVFQLKTRIETLEVMVKELWDQPSHGRAEAFTVGRQVALRENLITQAKGKSVTLHAGTVGTILEDYSPLIEVEFEGITTTVVEKESLILVK